MVKFNFFYNKNKITLDVKECKNIFEKTTGLMFRKKSPSLLFIFNGPVNVSIHSFFCVPFVAVWFNENKIIDKKYIKSWKINIKPKKKFDKLLEIPIWSREFNLFSDEFRKV